MDSTFAVHAVSQAGTWIWQEPVSTFHQAQIQDRNWDDQANDPIDHRLHLPTFLNTRSSPCFDEGPILSPTQTMKPSRSQLGLGSGSNSGRTWAPFSQTCKPGNGPAAALASAQHAWVTPRRASLDPELATRVQSRPLELEHHSAILLKQVFVHPSGQISALSIIFSMAVAKVDAMKRLRPDRRLLCLCGQKCSTDALSEASLRVPESPLQGLCQNTTSTRLFVVYRSMP